MPTPIYITSHTLRDPAGAKQGAKQPGIERHRPTPSVRSQQFVPDLSGSCPMVPLVSLQFAR